MYIGRIPGLGAIFLSQRVPAGESEAAVHLGHHHGADGLYLAATALLLSRVLGRFPPGRRRTVFAAYLSLMLAYGVGNIANDAWIEQIWKRGWTGVAAPNVLQPALNLGWGAVALCAALIHLFVFRRIGCPPALPVRRADVPAARRP
ncbi:MAG: hypothetical protein ACR2OO_04270 [Thermomicrobiales bacterium]